MPKGKRKVDERAVPNPFHAGQRIGIDHLLLDGVIEHIPQH